MANKYNPITVYGVEYKSIRQAARALNAKYEKVLNRLRRGFTPEQAFSNESPICYIHEVIVEGTPYTSVKEAAKHYGVKYSTVCYRLKTGRSIEQALGIEPLGEPNPTKASEICIEKRSHSYGDIVIDDVKYSSIAKATKALGLSKDTVYRRLKSGDTIEQAFGLEPSPLHRARAVVVRDVFYPSVTEAAKAHGLKPSIVFKALRNGRTIEQALKLEPYIPPAPSSSVKVKVENKEYPSIVAVAEAYNRSPRAVSAAINRGKTVEEALGLVQPCKLVVENVPYPTVAAAAEHYNIDPYTVYQRFRYGWDIDKAFTTPPQKKPWLRKENKDAPKSENEEKKEA